MNGHSDTIDIQIEAAEERDLEHDISVMEQNLDKFGTSHKNAQQVVRDLYAQCETQTVA